MELTTENNKAVNENPSAEAPFLYWRKKVVARKGLDHIVFNIEDIACFYTKDRLVFLVDKDGMKYYLDDNLSRLEKELDPALFFRVNRQYIVHIRYIRKFRTYERLRIQIELGLPTSVSLLTSQAATPVFRKWVYEQ